MVRRSRPFPLGLVLIACLLGSLAHIALIPASADATFPGRNGLVAFGIVSEYESTEDDAFVLPRYIGLVERDGRNRRRLARGAWPAFSPRGRVLAAVGRRPGIVLRRLDGSFVGRLTHGRTDGEPAWSPSGRRLAFTRGLESSRFYEYRFHGSQDIYTIGRDGTKPALLASGGEDPAWSSRREIAFVSADDSDDCDDCNDTGEEGFQPWQPPTIMAIGASGGPVRTLARDGFNPDWSPSGKRLAFIRFGEAFDAHNKLFVVNRDGTGLRRVYRGPGNLLSPTWSPDGRKIAFLAGDKVLVVPADGGKARRVLRLPWRDILCDFCDVWVERPEYLVWQATQ